MGLDIKKRGESTPLVKSKKTKEWGDSIPWHIPGDKGGSGSYIRRGGEGLRESTEEGEKGWRSLVLWSANTNKRKRLLPNLMEKETDMEETILRSQKMSGEKKWGGV